MTAKEYFGEVFLIDKQIAAKLSALSRLKDLAEKCTSVLSGMPGGGLSKFDDTITKMVDYEREIDEDIDRLIDVKRERQRTIEKLPNAEYRLILIKRYICGERWEKIAVDLGYDLRWVHRLHSRALKESQIFLTGH